MKVTAIIAAAGSGNRMGAGKNKVLLEIGGREIISRTVEVFENCPLIDEIIIVTRSCDIDECKSAVKRFGKVSAVTAGGETRQESVLIGLKKAKGADFAVIHDGARALITSELIENVLLDAQKYGAATVGVTPKDSLKTVDENGFVSSTIDRSTARAVQTPQVFAYPSILSAHLSAANDGFSATDDCAVYEKYIGKVYVTEGSYENIKLTTPEDLLIAERILNEREPRRKKS